MRPMVVDASVAIKLFFEEEYTPVARQIFQANFAFHVPELFLLETDNLMCKRIRRELLSLEQAQVVRGLMRRLSIQMHADSLLLDSAFHIAHRTGRSLYDCLYLALAELLEGQMVTADRRLYEGLAHTPFARHILWIEDAA